MNLSDYQLDRLREDAEIGLYRARHRNAADTVLVVRPTSSAPSVDLVERLEQEFECRSQLDPAWALCPLALQRLEGRVSLVLGDPGGQTLDGLLERPLSLSPFLHLACGLAEAIKHVHSAGLIHKDIRPSNVFVESTGRVLLSGFGFASRLTRERQIPGPSEIIPGSLAYMAPEQTGRVNRSTDTRSDLYSLGITLYEMLVGDLPFTATQPSEWVYCHVARLPPPPSVRVEGVPNAIERIILKLLEKNVEERYQTAAGVEHDLRLCLAQYELGHDPQLETLGEHDVPSRLVIPEKLYGRETETKALIEAFENVASHGTSDLVLVTGDSGIGKSAVISGLQSAVYAAGGLFAAGKFDRYKRHIPYATLAEAFQALFRQILSQADKDLKQWRESLQAALGANGQIIVDLFPEIGLIIGEQPALPSVSPQEAKNRFFVVFRRFIEVFAQPDHPLVLFLDDLQWLDEATIELLKLLAGDEQIPHLLLLGAYRDKEVDEAHDLTQSLEVISAARGEVQVLHLQPLRLTDVTALVSDALYAKGADVQDLSEIIFEKTNGHPFFVVQFLRSLEADELLYFDAEAGRWSWDLERIRAQAITDNVVNLVTEKLSRYGGRSGDLIRHLACVGKGATVEMLGELLGLSEAEITSALRGLVNAGLVARVDRACVFVHDSVREAAYTLVPDADRPEIHLRIGRRLRDCLHGREFEDGIFEAADHLNRGSSLLIDDAERAKVAELNLLAGIRAKASAAYSAALNYLVAGSSLLGEQSWTHNYRLTFDTHLNRAECEFMAGDVVKAEKRLVELSRRAQSLKDLGLVVGRQMGLYIYLRRIDHAIQLSVDYLAQLGVVLPIEPTLADLEHEYDLLMRRIGQRDINDLADLPLASDAQSLQILEALSHLFQPAGEVKTRLHALATLRMANVSVIHGNANESVHAYASLAGLVLGWTVGTFEEALAFGRVAIRLIEERGLGRHASRGYAIIAGTIGPWSRPLAECYAIGVKAAEIGRQQGGVAYSGYAWGCALTALLDSGRSLAEVDRQATNSLAILAKLKFPLVIEFITAQLMLVRALRGMSRELISMTGGEFDEEAYRTKLEQSPHTWHAIIRYKIRKVQLLVIADDTQGAMALLPWIDRDVAQLKVFEAAEYQFYSALARAASLAMAVETGSNEELWARLKASHLKLKEWARLCPDNFAARCHLVEARIAQLEGRELEAERLFEAAIRFARQYGSVHVEALANELASRFHAERGLDTAADAYLRNARSCYAQWGAAGKVGQLDQLNPQLADASPVSRLDGGGTGARLQALDLAAAVDVYHALSREIVLERLIEQLMETVVEHAGAVRGLLLLSHEGRLRIVAEAATDHNSVTVRPRKPAHFSGELPQSVLHYVARSHDVVIIDDALEPNAHSGDPYIISARPRSILCMPLVKQGRMVAVLYLENNLSAGTFTKDRLAILQIIAAQAAISIENAELFQNLQRTQEEIRQASAELRRSLDMIPALAWSAWPDGSFEFSNKQWHDYTGISAEEARGGTWLQAFHSDDCEKVTEKWKYLSKFRTSGEFEARMRRFDGQYRSFLVRITPMRDERGEVVKWHGTNTDIDDLKRAEEAQENLARVSRVTALGELTVSIAHEVNQPLMAIVTNAATCLRWLNSSTPDIAEARIAAERIIRDGHRAGDVIASIRAMAKNSARKVTALRVDDIILEVLQLTRNEVERHAISVETHFADDAVLISADRVQMQQVILNLVMNGIEAIAAVGDENRLLRVESAPGEPGCIVVSVSDTGLGLRVQDTDRVFDAFYTTKPEGIGIGLSICRTIVEAHGGRLFTAPNSPRGTVFSFSVPAFVEGFVVDHAFA